MWNPREIEVEWVVLRHGMTAGNEEHRYIGRTDEPLSHAGKQALKEQWSEETLPMISKLWISSRKRCEMTANILYPNLEGIVIPGLEEMNFGAFEGKNYIELTGNPAYQEWIDSGGEAAVPGGESREAFCRRVEGAVRVIWKQLCEMEETVRPKRIGLIVHGGTIMAMLSRFAGGDYYSYHVEPGEGFLCRAIGTSNSFRLEILQQWNKK